MAKQIQGHCPNCGPDIWADIAGEHIVNDDQSGVWSRTSYRILCCAGCKTIYFQERFIFSEDYDHVYDPNTGEHDIKYDERITHWPQPARRKQPSWFDITEIDRGLFDLLEETYKALDVGAHVLAATGARTVFDRASELLGVDPGVTFAEKLRALSDNHKIGTAEREHLDALTDAGGAAAHRGWTPTVDQLDTIMSILEAFIHRTFVLDQQVKRLRSEIPRKSPRKGGASDKSAKPSKT